MRRKNILITGRPGVGKTTLIRKLADKLRGRAPQGFYTREIRRAGVRVGFELVDLSGERLTLAHVDFGGRNRVGKYGVDVGSFDEYLRAHDFAGGAGKLIIIDEIGKMECFSGIFVRMIGRILDSDKFVIATVAARGAGTIQAAKDRQDAHLIRIDFSNRDSLAGRIVHLIAREEAGP